MKYSIEMELMALLILAIIILFHMGMPNDSTGRRMFTISLGLSELTIVFNIITVLVMQNASAPLVLNYAMNTLYFALQYVSFSVMVIYAFYMLYEHAANVKKLKAAIRLVCVLLFLLLLHLTVNPWTGWLFYFENGVYTRGPGNRAGHLVLFVELFFFSLSYFRQRQTAGRSLRQLMRVLVPVLVLILFIQAALPGIILNGTISAVSSLIFFICFQNNRIDQDALTGLFSRNAFFYDFTARKSQGERLHLVMLHMEQLSRFYKKNGIKKGDFLLLLAARYLEGYSEQYQAYRIGNASFLLMGTASGQEEEEKIVNGLQEHFDSAWIPGIRGRVVWATISHMVSDEAGDEGMKALEALEYAVFQERESGEARPVRFDGRMRELFSRQEYLTGRLKTAVEKDLFEVYYQPVYCCESGKFCTAEALLRLRDEAGRMLSPEEFIPLAEKNGMLNEISETVIRKAKALLEANPDCGLKKISVNFSYQQLEDLEFMKEIRRLEKSSTAPSGWLRIEITERAMAENKRAVETVMKSLAKRDIRFYLDDFGIGYSNLAAMLSLPFEAVKLDMSLLKAAVGEDRGRERRSLKLIVEMLHNSGFLVVMEGVETKEEKELAKDLGIDRIQGYYYARPMPEDELLLFLRKEEIHWKKNSF